MMLHSIHLNIPHPTLRKTTTEWHLELNVQLEYVYTFTINASIQFSKI